MAVFVDGCFWHGCPEHGTKPSTNAGYWAGKIDGNKARDRDTDSRLRAAGWTPLRVWEHDDIERSAQLIIETVTRRTPPGSGDFV